MKLLKEFLKGFLIGVSTTIGIVSTITLGAILNVALHESKKEAKTYTVHTAYKGRR